MFALFQARANSFHEPDIPDISDAISDARGEFRSPRTEAPECASSRHYVLSADTQRKGFLILRHLIRNHLGSCGVGIPIGRRMRRSPSASRILL